MKNFKIITLLKIIGAAAAIYFLSTKLFSQIFIHNDAMVFHTYAQNIKDHLLYSVNSYYSVNGNLSFLFPFVLIPFSWFASPMLYVVIASAVISLFVLFILLYSIYRESNHKEIKSISTLLIIPVFFLLLNQLFFQMTSGTESSLTALLTLLFVIGFLNLLDNPKYFVFTIISGFLLYQSNAVFLIFVFLLTISTIAYNKEKKLQLRKFSSYYGSLIVIDSLIKLLIFNKVILLDYCINYFLHNDIFGSTVVWHSLYPKALFLLYVAPFFIIVLISAKKINNKYSPLLLSVFFFVVILMNFYSPVEDNFRFLFPLLPLTIYAAVLSLDGLVSSFHREDVVSAVPSSIIMLFSVFIFFYITTIKVDQYPIEEKPGESAFPGLERELTGYKVVSFNFSELLNTGYRLIPEDLFGFHTPQSHWSITNFINDSEADLIFIPSIEHFNFGEIFSEESFKNKYIILSSPSKRRIAISRKDPQKAAMLLELFRNRYSNFRKIKN